MLVLTVKTGERVILKDVEHGTEMSVMLCRADNDKAKIGIEAPREVSILRESLALEDENHE